MRVHRLHLVLEKTEVFGNNVTQPDKRQVEHLMSAKEIKQNRSQCCSDSSNDDGETSEECFDLKQVSRPNYCMVSPKKLCD